MKIEKLKLTHGQTHGQAAGEYLSGQTKLNEVEK